MIVNMIARIRELLLDLLCDCEYLPSLHFVTCIVDIFGLNYFCDPNRIPISLKLRKILSKFLAASLVNSIFYFRCLPCLGPCDNCDSSGQCLAVGNALIRAAIMAVQGCCLFAVLLLAIIVFRHRKCKVNKKISSTKLHKY